MHPILPIILASTSPRRHALLNQINVPHLCLSVEIDETPFANESPSMYIERMVRQKAYAAVATIDKVMQDYQAAFIITADTIGVLASGAVLQKPQNYQAAVAMWQQMSNTTHEVWTAVQVSKVVKDNQTFALLTEECQIVKTQVSFVEITTQMMAAYWATGEPKDKAGGYAIQGQGAAWVKSIQGSYSNVVGLPLVETLELINKSA